MLTALQRMIRRLRRTLGTGEAHADRAIAKRLRRRFEQDLAQATVEGLHLYAQDGVITIYGTVPHTLDRDLVVSIVRQTNGVEDVVSHLDIGETSDEGRRVRE